MKSPPRTVQSVAVLLLFSSVLSSCAISEPAADLIFHNAAIWTVDPTNPSGQAVAIREDRIVRIGSNSQVLELQGPETETVDLGGAFMVPGFSDNHVHFQSADRFLEFNIMNVSTQEEFEIRLRQVVDSLPEGEWILGGFWGAYDQWAADSTGGEIRQPFSPQIALIEEFTTKHPVFIRKFDNSEYAANRAALQAVGLEPDNPKAEGIEFLKDAAGKATGILRGEGVRRLFNPTVPSDFSHQRRLQQTRIALDEIRRHGVTNVSDMSPWEQFDIYQELREKGELTTRIHFRPHMEEVQRLMDENIQIGSGDEWIRMGALKGHIDGIMGTSSARFFEPYSHDPSLRGRWRRLMVDEDGEFVEGQFLGYMIDIDNANLQLSVHAIGDEANHLLLNYLEEMNSKNGIKDRRFRLVHAQVVAEDDFVRMGQLNIIAEVQPFHLSDDMRWMEERIGHERCRGAYAFKRIQDSGAMLSFGSDWPGTSAAEYPINPMLGLYAAVTRQTRSGHPTEGWFPEQKISIEDAIRAYTYNTAYGNFEEEDKGSIEVGKLADLIVLSQNLLEIPAQEILNTETLYTVVGGKIVFRRD